MNKIINLEENAHTVGVLSTLSFMAWPIFTKLRMNVKPQEGIPKPHEPTTLSRPPTCSTPLKFCGHVTMKIHTDAILATGFELRITAFPSSNVPYACLCLGS